MNNTTKLAIIFLVIGLVVAGAFYVYRSIKTEYFSVKKEVKEGLIAKEKANFLGNMVGGVFGGLTGRD